MASTFVPTKSHIIFAICLPLAIVVGYLLAAPIDYSGLATLVLVAAVLSVPVFMRWHHALLLFSCNALMSFYSLPGNPPFWMAMTMISLFFTVLNRSLGRDLRFFQAREVAFSLLALLAVMLVTAQLTGGIGLRTFGASSFGGKRYLSILAAVLLYFALSTPHMNPKRAGFWSALFFLSPLTVVAGYLAVAFGPASYNVLVQLFPIQGSIGEMQSVSETGASGLIRLGGLGGVSVAIVCYLLGQHGIRCTLDLKKPWRLMFLVVAFVAALLSGFRTVTIMLMLFFVITFWVEGLFNSRNLIVTLLVGTLLAAITLPNVRKLPLGMQRSLAFLPVDVDFDARQSAEGSSQWRIDLWKSVLPEVPKHLLLGKGYAINPMDLALANISKNGEAAEGFILAGDYHSGPLSTIIPFGLPGVAAFIWFWVASVKALNQNRLYGDPALKKVNNFLFAFFIARIICYLFVFGSLYSDLSFFTAIIGFSISLNGGVRTAPKEELEETEEMAELGQAPLEY